MSRRDRHTAGLRIKPRSAATGAADHAHVFFQLPPLHSAIGRTMPRQQLRNNPFEVPAIFHSVLTAAPGERDMVLPRAVQPNFLQFETELAPRSFEHCAR